MNWDNIDLNALDSTAVQTAQETLIQLIEGQVPDLDIRRGGVRGLLVSPLSILLTAQDVLAQRLSDSQSLLNVINDPELYSDDLVAALLSNYRITRSAAGTATGSLLLLFSELQPVTIYSGTVFQTDEGIQFTTTSTVRGRTSATAVTLTTDQLLELRVDGNYGLIVPVTAVATGITGNIARDTELESDTVFANLVGAYANEDFAGGVAAESNTSLVNRLSTGISTRTFSNRASLLGLLNDEFETIKAVSIIGMGDAEMSRDQRLLLPMSGGGRTDVYLRSTNTPETYTATLPATVITSAVPSPSPLSSPLPSPEASPVPIDDEDATFDPEYGNWLLNIGRAVTPGFYRVISVKPENAVSATPAYEIISTELGTDLSVDFYVPDIEDPLESNFSAFQTASVVFLDDDTDISELPAGTTQYYDVTFLRMPLVDEVQQYLTQRSIRPPAADILVKAAIPNIISLDIELTLPAGGDISIPSLQTALTTFVNNRSFGATLRDSELAAVIIPLLPAGSSVDSVLISSQIMLPNYVDNVITDAAEVPPIDEPGLYSTRRTIALMLKAEDIVINVSYSELEE